MTEEIGYRRLRAPAEDFGILVDPPRASIAALLEQPRGDLSSFNAVVADARSQLLAAAAQYTAQYRNVAIPADSDRIFLAGHQPQLFHAGVWFKNFLLADLAKEHQAVAVNLIIDSDAMRSAAIAVPTGTTSDPHIDSVLFDRSSEEVPYEEHAIQDRQLFDSFGRRALNALQSLVPHPFLESFWPRVIERSRAEQNLGLAISQARHLVEGDWGISTLELPQSWLCKLPPFREFAAHLLCEARRLREVYNEAVDVYRHANRIRSKAHPVPDLARVDDWIETPFWIWTSQLPRRHRLFVKSSHGQLLLSDLNGLEFELSSSTATAIEQLEALEARGIKLRTRALITTMFARLFLGDVFIHGIGGAKYDQVTDVIIRRFFGIQPPAYLAVTATLRLPVARPAVQESDLQKIQEQMRELEYHPERWIDNPSPSAQPHVDAKRHWVQTPQNPQNARQRCHAIRDANAALQPFVESIKQKLLAERESTRRLLRVEKLLASREYAFCLHPAEQLQKLFDLATL